MASSVITASLGMTSAPPLSPVFNKLRAAIAWPRRHSIDCEDRLTALLIHARQSAVACSVLAWSCSACLPVSCQAQNTAPPAIRTTVHTLAGGEPRCEPPRDETPPAVAAGPVYYAHTFGTASWLDGALCGQIFFLPPDTARLPNFKGLTPVGTIYTRQLNVPNRDWQEGFPGITNRFEWFAIEYTGIIRPRNKGRYSLRLVSDDGSRLYIDDKVIVNNDGVHPPVSEDGRVNLNEGRHTIRIQYFQGPRFRVALQLYCTAPGGRERLFPDCGFDLETPITTEVTETIDYPEVTATFCVPSGVMNNCTPNEPTVEPAGPNLYHVVLPAQFMVGIPNPGNLPITVLRASGEVCWDPRLGLEATAQSLGMPRDAGCNGPQGSPWYEKAGKGFMKPDEKPGALIYWTEQGTSYLAVNGRTSNLFKNGSGYSEFKGHEGAFEFYVQVGEPPQKR